MDDYERDALMEMGFDPDSPMVQAGMTLVRYELEMLRYRIFGPDA